MKIITREYAFESESEREEREAVDAGAFEYASPSDAWEAIWQAWYDEIEERRFQALG